MIIYYNNEIDVRVYLLSTSFYFRKGDYKNESIFTAKIF